MIFYASDVVVIVKVILVDMTIYLYIIAKIPRGQIDYIGIGELMVFD